MDAEQFRKAAHVVVEDIISYKQTLTQRRIVPDVAPGYLKDQLPSVVPIESQTWDVIQADVEKFVLPGMTHWQHPGFMAYYPADTSYPAMLGELYSAAFNIPGFNWISSPVSTELEIVVMDWLARLLNLPDCFRSHSAGGGMITTTTSEATICAIIPARNRVITKICRSEGLEPSAPGWEERAFTIQSRLVVLASDQAHSCARKGALVTGTRFRSIKTSSGDGYTVHPHDLRQEIIQCERDGLIPCFLTLSIGTTSSCAIDPILDITKSLDKHKDIWVHIDAAYAGAALVCDEYHSLSSTLENVDSFVFNMHKWLAVTFDASCVWLRNKTELIQALSLKQNPPFLRCDLDIESKPVEYNDWGIVFGRRFRALKVWLVLRSYGVKGLQEHVRKGIRLAGMLYNLMMTRMDLFDVFSDPSFGLVTFSSKLPRRYPEHDGSKHQPVDQVSSVAHDQETHLSREPKHTNGHVDGFNLCKSGEESKVSQAALNALTRSVMAKINATGNIFLTETMVGDKMLIRVSCGGQNTEESHILIAVKIMIEATEDCLHEHHDRTKA